MYCVVLRKIAVAELGSRGDRDKSMYSSSKDSF